MAYQPSAHHHHQYGRPQHPQIPPQPLPDLSPYNGQRGSLVFSLDVVQQPERARMCGFGDKDRRPITPPPCVRLVIKDFTTGREIHPKDINSQHFVLNVDLWKADGSMAANLVRHASNTPSSSISMATTVSFPPGPPPPPEATMAWVMGPNGQPVQVQGAPTYAGQASYPQPSYGYPNYQQPPGGGHSYTQVQGNFTRNLIGSVAVSAAPLSDVDGRSGLWFVLQDLSVRQEGSFRLKLSFADVSELGAMLANSLSSSANNGNANNTANNSGSSPASSSDSDKERAMNANKLATQTCPVLATCFSDVFHVHSAKKFPGVKESTALSKCFAQQGVKIPIRKEGKNPKDEDDDD